MKVLIISKGIPNKINPQFGCFAMDQAKALKASGHDVAIMFLNGFMGKIWKKPGFYHWSQDGIQCFESYGLPTEILKRISVKSGLWIEGKWARRTFDRIISIFGFPDIVHAHFLETMTQAASIKKTFPIKLVGTEHWSKLAVDNLDKRVLEYGKYAYPKVDKLICVSENLRKYVLRHFGKDSCVIHNLIDTSQLKPACKHTSNPKFTIAGVGSLIPRKGFDILIDAISRTVIDKDKIAVNIYGDGPAYSELQNKIIEKGLQNTIHLCGRKCKSEIYEALHNTDLFVLSSLLENFSVAVIEATGNGVPAVATLCGGVEEYPVKEVIKIPINDAVAMAKAIETAYHQKDTVNRESIQTQTLKYFSPQEIIRQVEIVYTQLDNNKR